MAVETFHTGAKNKMVYQEKTAFFYAFDFINKTIKHLYTFIKITPFTFRQISK